jgi:hypothetical protein
MVNLHFNLLLLLPIPLVFDNFLNFRTILLYNLIDFRLRNGVV